MISAQIIGSEAVGNRFREMSAQAMPKLMARIQKVTIQLQAKVIQDKLSGQVLKVRTNNLRSSIHQEVTMSGSKVTGVVGTNVEYAAFHEYGFEGTVEVKEYMRRTKAEKIYFKSGKRKGLKNELASVKSQKKKKATVTVKAHTRKVNYPEHSFLRSAMTDMEGEIKVAISEGIKEVIG